VLFPDPDILPDANLDPLVCEGTGEGGGLFHAWKLFCSIDVEGGREYGFAVTDIVPGWTELSVGEGRKRTYPTTSKRLSLRR